MYGGTFAKLKTKEKHGRRETDVLMCIDNYYESIDSILQALYDYHGISKDEDDYYDDFDTEASDDYIDSEACGRQEIEQCGLILERYVDELDALKPDETSDALILKIVEGAVRSLNKLNEKCEYELAESSITDDICDLMHRAALEAGLEDAPDNVTDEWREF